MKLAIEYQPWRSCLGQRVYAVYLGGEDVSPAGLIHPIELFDTEAQAREYCEGRQKSRIVAEYDL